LCGGFVLKGQFTREGGHIFLRERSKEREGPGTKSMEARRSGEGRAEVWLIALACPKKRRVKAIALSD